MEPFGTIQDYVTGELAYLEADGILVYRDLQFKRHFFYTKSDGHLKHGIILDIDDLLLTNNDASSFDVRLSLVQAVTTFLHKHRVRVDLLRGGRPADLSELREKGFDIWRYISPE